MRTAGDPVAAIGSIREAVRQIDPTLPLMNVTTQLDEVERRFLQEKVFAQASTLFGALALLLASVGLFGVDVYSVARRTYEIGIRMALGARRQDVLQLVMRESMVLVAAGLAIGLGGAVAASRLVSSLLFGVAPTDTDDDGGRDDRAGGCLVARRVSAGKTCVRNRPDGGASLRVALSSIQPPSTAFLTARDQTRAAVGKASSCPAS